MVVATNHFIPGGKTTQFHYPRKDLSMEASELWTLAEECYNKMIGNDTATPIKMVPVLPNLATTTDDITIFATSSIVNNKDRYYVVTRQQELKNELVNSGSRNHYKDTPSGDAHCKGVRIVISNTFSGGGLSAPLFISVFGLTEEELPKDDGIIIEVPRLCNGSHQDIYAQGIGYLCFVRSNNKQEHKIVENVNTNNEQDQMQDQEDVLTSTDSSTNISNEAKQTLSYGKLVYHPFIKRI